MIKYILLILAVTQIMGCASLHRTGHYETILNAKGEPELDSKGRKKQYKVYDDFQEMKGGGKSDMKKGTIERKSPWTIPDFPEFEINKD